MSVFGTILADTHYWDHMNGWGGGWMWLWGVAMMVLFVTLIAWLVRSADAVSPRQNQPPDPAARAREIVAERYASGELTTEEFRERVSELR